MISPFPKNLAPRPPEGDSFAGCVGGKCRAGTRAPRGPRGRRRVATVPVVPVVPVALCRTGVTGEKNGSCI